MNKPKAELKEEYLRWCEENSTEPVTQRTFKNRLMEKGIGDYKGTGGQRCWKGIRLKTEQEFSGKSGKINENVNTSGKKWQDLQESSYIKEKQKNFT